jgi:diguanylate cyclase (GGDEF)-like protein
MANRLRGVSNKSIAFISVTTNPATDKYSELISHQAQFLQDESGAHYTSITTGVLRAMENVDDAIDRTAPVSHGTDGGLSDLHLMSTALQKERELRGRMLGRIQDVVYVLDVREDRLLFISSEISLLLGHPWTYIQSWGGTLFTALMHPEDLASRPFFIARLSSLRDGEMLELEYRMRDARGQWRWMRSREVVLDRTEKEEPHRVLGIAEDFTARRRDEDRLRELALVDPLTGLRNRRGFVTIAEQYVRIARRHGQKFSLFFFDLDRFKAINDQFGHNEGDEALKAAAEVLRRTFRSSDILCRFGGDEFAAIAVDAAGHGAQVLKERIHKGLQDWNGKSAKPYRIEFSIGYSIFDPSVLQEGTDDARLFDESVRTADEAMYADKAARKAAAVAG